MPTIRNHSSRTLLSTRETARTTLGWEEAGASLPAIDRRSRTVTIPR